MIRSDNGVFEPGEACNREYRVEIYHKPGLSAKAVCGPKTIEEATGKTSVQIMDEIAEQSCWLPLFHKYKTAVKFLDFAFCFTQCTEYEAKIYWADGFLSVELVSPAMYFLHRSHAMLAALILICDDFAVIKRGCSGDEILFSLRLESHEIFPHG